MSTMRASHYYRARCGTYDLLLRSLSSLKYLSEPSLPRLRLLFHELFQSGEHHFPILFGVFARLFAWIVVLRERDAGPLALAGQFNGDGVIVFRLVRESREWAEMTVLQYVSRRELRAPFVLLVLVMALRAGVWSALTTFVPIYLVREGASILAGGFALTVFNLSGALLGLFTGAVSDRIGRRVTVVGSMVITTLALGGFLTSTGILRLVWFGVAGVGLLSVTPIGVVMAQELHPHHRATVSGVMMGTTFGLGTLALVPVVGRVGDTMSMGTGLWLLVGVSALASLLALLLPTPESAEEQGGQAKKVRADGSRRHPNE